MECLKRFIRPFLREHPTIHWIVSGLYNAPAPFAVSFIRSLIATKRLTGRFFPTLVRLGTGQTFRVKANRNASVLLHGVLTVNQWNGSSLPSSLTLGAGSTLIIDGNFEIGPNVHISVADRAFLNIKGINTSSGSGVTCDSRIMVERSCVIGSDCIIAWDCFINDSDWQVIHGSVGTEPVTIGDNVWISHGCSILKGSAIGSGSIIGAKSVVNSKFYLKNALIVGTPARVCRQGVQWQR